SLLHRRSRQRAHASKTVASVAGTRLHQRPPWPDSRTHRPEARRARSGRNCHCHSGGGDEGPAPGANRRGRSGRRSMIFGERPVESAAGTILAHSVRAGRLVLKKGRRLSGADVAAMKAAEIATVMVAELESGDVGEDDAAARLAAAISGDFIVPRPPFTGRVNMHASRRGVLIVDRDRLDRINLVDEAITVATLEPFALVDADDMAATVKIIPFSVPETELQRCIQVASG